jgi:hypothetical protein
MVRLIDTDIFVELPFELFRGRGNGLLGQLELLHSLRLSEETRAEGV